MMCQMGHGPGRADLFALRRTPSALALSVLKRRLERLAQLGLVVLIQRRRRARSAAVKSGEPGARRSGRVCKASQAQQPFPAPEKEEEETQQARSRTPEKRRKKNTTTTPPAKTTKRKGTWVTGMKTSAVVNNAGGGGKRRKISRPVGMSDYFGVRWRGRPIQLTDLTNEWTDELTCGPMNGRMNGPVDQ